ncbi:MAG: AI-2E family transporter [Rhizobiales bacterium]|nr:AI-2E family transporter [Hyphomicrobiales bacterium]
MTWQRQALYWAVALVLFVAFLVTFSGILLPFVAGMILAYILDPVADRFERWGLSRTAATITILILFVLVFLLALLVIVPLLGNQLVEFIQQVPQYIRSLHAVLMSDFVSNLIGQLPFNISDAQSMVGNFLDEGISFITKLLTSLLSGGQALLNIISLFVITPVVAFYLLHDWDHLVAKLNSWLPRDHAPTIRRLAAEMSMMIAGFMRGQGLICVLLGLFYAVALTLVGLNFGLLIGLGIGLIGFIPFIGAITGAVLSIGIALAQFLPEQNYLAVVLVAAIFAIGQAVEGNVLQPWLLGDRVQLHPVWLMFSLFAFGALFGFLGLLIAVPTAACIGVLARFGIEQYLSSHLYLGDGPPEP